MKHTYIYILLATLLGICFGCARQVPNDNLLEGKTDIAANTFIKSDFGIDARFYDENLFEKYVLQPQKDYEDTIIIFRRIINKDFATDNDTLFLFENQDSLYK